MKKHSATKHSGFTLVELLIVLAVLALIAVFAVFTVMDSIAKARDSQRVQELEAVAEALNYYYLANETYPCESDSMNGFIGQGGDIDTVLEEYMPSVPTDPKHDGTDYFYYYDGYHGCVGGPEDDYFAALMVDNFETDTYLDHHGNLEQACEYTWGAEGSEDPDYVIKLYPYCD